MIKKIVEKIRSLTFSRVLENRIRRIVELSTLLFGGLLVFVSTFKIVFLSDTFMNNAIGLSVGLIAIQIAYRGLMEDLPRSGAMVNKRRFWE